MPETKEHGSMSTIVASKDALLQRLRENKDKHNVIYEAAVSGYYKKIAKELDDKIDLADRLIAEYEKKKHQVLTKNTFHATFKTQLNPTSFNSKFPENHLYDYDRAIAMLELSVHDDFALTSQEFDRYAMNNWEWKQTFLSTNSTYISSLYSCNTGAMHFGTGSYNGVQISGLTAKF